MSRTWLKKPRLWQKLALSVLVPPLLLLVLEGFARLAEKAAVYRPDRDFLYVMASDGSWERRRGTQINEQGYRDGEIEVPKPAGRFRILALGGSTTFGHQLHDDETWAYFLEKSLRDRGLDAEVINGGVSGWGAERCLLRLERDAGWMEPNLVVLYTGWNFPEISSTRSYHPFPYQLDRVRHLPNWVRNSRLFLVLCKNMNALQGRGHRTPAPVVELGPPGHELLGRRVRAFADWQAKSAVLSAVVLYPGLVGKTSPLAEGHQYPDLLSAHHDLGPEGIEGAVGKARRLLRQAHRAIERAAEAGALPVLDVAKTFSAAPPEKRSQWFMDRMHLTAAGNCIFAQAIERELERASLLPLQD